LDIAGTAWKSGAVKGSTGRPVLLLLNYLLNLESNHALTFVSIDKTAIKKVVKKVVNRPAKTAVKA
jgi:leucyl aminopeptidase